MLHYQCLHTMQNLHKTLLMHAFILLIFLLEKTYHKFMAELTKVFLLVRTIEDWRNF